jgi:hypothetical protein
MGKQDENLDIIVNPEFQKKVFKKAAEMERTSSKVAVIDDEHFGNLQISFEELESTLYIFDSPIELSSKKIYLGGKI